MPFRSGRRIWSVGVKHLGGESREVAEPAFAECVGHRRIDGAAKGSVTIGYKVGVDLVPDNVANRWD